VFNTHSRKKIYISDTTEKARNTTILFPLNFPYRMQLAVFRFKPRLFLFLKQNIRIQRTSGFANGNEQLICPGHIPCRSSPVDPALCRV